MLESIWLLFSNIQYLIDFSHLFCISVLNDIRNAVGKARLLMGAKGRLMQFTTLVSDCENKTGEQTLLLSDLQGFWDMVSFQVDDCYFMFATLEKLRGNNWIKEEPVKVQPKKKIIKVCCFFFKFYLYALMNFLSSSTHTTPCIHECGH